MPTGPKPTDHTGKTVGSYSVLSFARAKGKHRFFLCRCRCGIKKEIRADRLSSGHPTACRSCAKKGQPAHNKTHGKRHVPEYNVWCNMRRRCYEATNHKYPDYGGRGIRVCDRWLGPAGFANFYADMGKRPSRKHSIERIENNGHYEPGNCKWATAKQQASNRRKAPPRPSHPNSLKNLRPMTREWSQQIQAKRRAKLGIK